MILKVHAPAPSNRFPMVEGVELEDGPLYSDVLLDRVDEFEVFGPLNVDVGRLANNLDPHDPDPEQEMEGRYIGCVYEQIVTPTRRINHGGPRIAHHLFGDPRDQNEGHDPGDYLRVWVATLWRRSVDAGPLPLVENVVTFNTRAWLMTDDGATIERHGP